MQAKPYTSGQAYR